MKIDVIEAGHEGYRTKYQNASWRVGMITPAERFENITYLERHNQTDEIFILLKGRAVLIGREDEILYTIELEAGKLYCVPEGCWHNIRMYEDSVVAVIENSDTSGENTDYAPILPAKCEPSNTPVLPETEVIVTADGISIESIDVGIPLETRIPRGVTSLNMPDAVAPMAEIRVQAADITHEKTGDVYCFDNAMIAVSARERGNYRITDPAGLYTYYDAVPLIYAMEISGENPCLTVESPLVYIESDITFREITGVARAEVAKSIVTRIRTEQPDSVMVNGVSLGTFRDRAPVEVISGEAGERNVFYFNGIPGIIARGEDGGTYAYRSYDRKKLSETNLAGWVVSGGAPGADSFLEAANVRLESGTVHEFFSGGEGTTLDATLVLDGCAVASATFGGARNGGIVRRATVVYESGDSKRRAYVGGDGSILGDPDRKYGEDEYSAEVWFFGGAIQYLNLGGRRGGRIYGNIKYEQYGGSLLNLYTGGYKAEHYGDVDITVYGGLWEKGFEQQDLQKGDARLRLYEGIRRQEFIEYPSIDKKNAAEYKLEVEYFSRADDFQFIRYEDRRQEVVDTSQDAERLVLRFLETRVADGFDKGTVKIRDGTGDSIYITFPNGQNMLIDTGRPNGGEYMVQDLKDLGVTKLDYVLITHEHTDHFGALGAICDAFEVGTFLCQKYINTAKMLRNAIASEGAQAVYLGLGDTFQIGEVRFDVISPEEELLASATDINIGSIVMVMTYGESKVLLTGDALTENEEMWLAREEIKELISDCSLLKLGHHGIFNANSPEFLAVVNADKYVITQMREYGTQLGQAVAQLQGAFGVTWDDIYVTGRHGMIKAVVEKGGKVDVSCQYVKTTPYYADYSQLDALTDSVEEEKLSPEEWKAWQEALQRVKRHFAYEEQRKVDGLCAYVKSVSTGKGEGK